MTTDEERALRESEEQAWRIIANVGGGDWTKETPKWQEAAARWRDKYIASARSNPRSPMPEVTDAERAQAYRWARFEDIRRRLYELQSEIMEHAVPTYGQARGICDALQAVMDAIPRERGYPLRVDIEVRYHR